MKQEFTSISVTKETSAKLRKLAKKKFEVPVSVQFLLAYFVDKDAKDS
jgi:hypothetical protein|tara:strand:+ start:5851 stop:5994 length:144 start_codon:yes stop_codon:yes gene_type:complete